jgi:hypothetical protein
MARRRPVRRCVSRVKLCLSCEGVVSTPASRCGTCGAFLLPTDAVHYPQRRGEIDAGNPLLGSVVDGKYRLHGVLGRGGLGTVFRAQHVGSLMTVALKVLHPRFAERPEYRRALLPEARRAAAVVDEHCARLLDANQTEDGVAYLAMELVDGTTLDLVVRQGPLQPSHALEILWQTTEALVAIHAAGLVHCDLSPRNVMVAVRGRQLRVKVLDFGIARSVTLAGRQQSGHGEFGGFVNPAFAAPELLDGRDVDPRADLYSLGTLAWLICTGAMPVDDTDPRRAAAAVAAGELRPFPARTGLPRRLVRLIRRCVAHDPAERPPSAAAVLRELAIVRGARRPLALRLAVAALGLGVLATFATRRPPVGPTPFLRPLSGSALTLADGPLAPGQPVQQRRSADLAAVTLHHGGFPAASLRAELVRDGRVVLRQPLEPELDAAASTLTLSVAQPGWQAVVRDLAGAARPLDLVFVVPGEPPLGSARVRVDDVPPSLEARAIDGDNALVAATALAYRARDDVALATLDARVTLAGGRRIDFALPPDGERLALGELLAAEVRIGTALGAVELVVAATDLAGNRTELPPLVFAAADVAAPRVVEVTGPGGEPFVPAVSGTARVRVRLSAIEPGCTLTIDHGGGAAAAVELPNGTDAATVNVHVKGHGSGGAWRFTVADAAGNRTEVDLPVVLRDRSLAVEFGGGPAARWLGGELVVAAGGATDAHCGSNWEIDGVRVELSAPPAAPGDAGLRWTPATPSAVRLEFGALPPGDHALRFDVHERGDDGERALRTDATVPLRVLPLAIDVRVPAAPRGAFLRGLLQAGVLAPRGPGYAEGTAWGIDPALRPYLRGTLWVGARSAVPLPIVPGDDGLLPAVVPVHGANRLAVELVDVLDRPVQLRVGDEPGVARGRGPGVPIAEFHWHDAAPTLVGEELLVEYGQPARVQLRCPLPFAPEHAAELRLSVAQSQLSPSQVRTVGDDESILVFDVPFVVWSVAAQLAGRTRDEFAGQLQSAIEAAHLYSPAGEHPLRLRVRTTRSTLLPLTLDELRELPHALGSLRLLPVLAPSGEFEEPLPPQAPPRATFRPQLAVAVRNMTDILLLDRELTWGAARALVDALPRLAANERAACVHRDDPLGERRMTAAALLPARAARAPDDASLAGVDFHQAWALSRLLGVVVVGDPDAFRLPLGCELELAAFGTGMRLGCQGVTAHGGSVSMAHFLAAEVGNARGETLSAAAEIAAGDVVPTAFGAPFVGLDFGLREWVLDLAHVPGAEALLSEWIGDHGVHLARVQGLASGALSPPEPLGQLRVLGVVRGLGAGQRAGLVDATGAPLDPRRHLDVPPSVPGVLRTEQLRRDGVDLLANAPDPRLPWLGFRVVGVPARLAGRERR